MTITTLGKEAPKAFCSRHSLFPTSIVSIAETMAKVRKRATAADTGPAPSTAEKPYKASKKENSSGFSVTDVLRVLGGLLLLNCTLSYFVTNNSLTWGWRPWYSKPANVISWLVRFHVLVSLSPLPSPLSLSTLLNC